MKSNAELKEREREQKKTTINHVSGLDIAYKTSNRDHPKKIKKIKHNNSDFDCFNSGIIKSQKKQRNLNKSI